MSRRVASLASQLKSRHPVLIEARSQLGEIQAEIDAELRRISGALTTEHEVAMRREREDFVYEAARLMRDRFLFQEVWE